MRAFLFASLFALVGCAGSARTQEPHPPATTAVEVPANGESPALAVWARLCGQYDSNRDERIAPGEYPRGELAFTRLDADQDGVVTVADFAEEWNERPRAKLMWGEGGPELGDEAPNFRLETTRGESIELASFRGELPVALVFGSFT